MSDHITQPQPGTPALDYEAVKDYFFHKLERDRFGKYRMDSALYHTAQWIFLQGCSERERLLAQRDELLAICRNVVERGIGGSDVRAMENAIAEAEARHA